MKKRHENIRQNGESVYLTRHFPFFVDKLFSIGYNFHEIKRNFLRKFKEGLMNNFWDTSVWGGINVFAMLLLGLLAASLIKKSIKALRDSLVPTSVLAGFVLLVVSGTYMTFSGESMFNTPFMGGDGFSILETITYHALALGFIASTFESSGEKGSKQRKIEIFNTGVTTVSTYLVQALVGMGITILIATFVTDIFPAAGMILPFGYGQGTGQAMNYGNIYEMDYGFVGGKSFGLAIATLGFLSASFGGVLYLSYLKKKNHLVKQDARTMKTVSNRSAKQDEIPLYESMDTLGVQLAFIFGSYVITYGIIYVLGELVPGLKSIMYGFNFLIGVLVATGVKKFIEVLEEKNILKKHYLNDFLMVRIRNICYDIMVVAGIAAIRVSTMEGYLVVLLIIGVVGATATFAYNYFVSRVLFKDYQDEQLVGMYGMLTGTASTGIVLLRELDPEFETPVSDNMVYQNFPAIIFGLPLMLIAAQAPENPVGTWLIALAFFVVLNIILFRKQIMGVFKK